MASGGNALETFLQNEEKRFQDISAQVLAEYENEVAGLLATEPDAHDLAHDLLTTDVELCAAYSGIEKVQEYEEKVYEFKHLLPVQYLNLVATTKDIKEKIDGKITIKDKDMNFEIGKKVLDNFLKMYLRRLDGTDDHLALIQEIHNSAQFMDKTREFIQNFAKKCKMIVILITAHGTEDGKIVFDSGNNLPNDEYLSAVSKLSEEYGINITVFMGQCFSHVFDDRNVGLQVQVKLTTSKDSPKNHLWLDLSYKPRAGDENKWDCVEVKDAKCRGFQRLAEAGPLSSQTENIAVLSARKEPVESSELTDMQVEDLCVNLENLTMD